MAFTFKEIQENYMGKGLVIAEVVERNNNQFAVGFEVLIITKVRSEAQLLLDMHKELGLEVVMIETFDPDAVACHFCDGELEFDNMEPADIATCFRTIFNMKTNNIN